MTLFARWFAWNIALGTRQRDRLAPHMLPTSSLDLELTRLRDRRALAALLALVVAHAASGDVSVSMIPDLVQGALYSPFSSGLVVVPCVVVGVLLSATVNHRARSLDRLRTALKPVGLFLLVLAPLVLLAVPGVQVLVGLVWLFLLPAWFTVANCVARLGVKHTFRAGDVNQLLPACIGLVTAAVTALSGVAHAVVGATGQAQFLGAVTAVIAVVTAAFAVREYRDLRGRGFAWTGAQPA